MSGSLRPEEISSILRREIEQFQGQVDVSDVGTVIQVGDGIARIYGLESAMASELLQFPSGVYGMALNLEEDNIGCAILGPYADIKEGDQVKRTGRVMSVPVGPALRGRVVNSLGQPIDGKGSIQTTEFRPLEMVAPGVIHRKGVHQPMQTGLKVVDSMFPIGRGQRELVIGDRQTGKTAILVDTIINQKGQDMYCVYVAVGQKSSSVATVVRKLEETGAMEYTTVVVAAASDPAPMLYIAPYAGCAMAEYELYRGGHALICYDDLTKHATAYRELSLLLRRPPGREAFPGDVFYLHSRLLERACKLSDEDGAGSLTALPVIETQQGDLSSYIPTNVISITDGQIFLETDLFFAGQRPAVNIGTSVSRVGGKAQVRAMRQVSGTLKLDLSQYQELAAFSQIGSDLDKATQARLARGRRMQELLKQGQYDPMPVEEQVISIWTATNGYIDDVAEDKVRTFEKSLLSFIRDKRANIIADLKAKREITKETEAALKAAVEEFKATGTAKALAQSA